MDASLDSFPYAGTTTTVESVFMGVPCITMRGGCHAHNVGVSLMSAIGLTEFIVENEARACFCSGCSISRAA